MASTSLKAALTIAVVIVVAAVLQFSGALAPVNAAPGRPLEVGQEVVTARWRMAVLGAELTEDKRLGAPQLQVTMRLTHTGEVARTPSADEFVRVESPAGRPQELRLPGVVCNPGVPTEVVLAADWPEEAPPGEVSVRVVLLDQKRVDLPYAVPQWEGGGARGHVDLIAPDHREET